MVAHSFTSMAQTKARFYHMQTIISGTDWLTSTTTTIGCGRDMERKKENNYLFISLCSISPQMSQKIHFINYYSRGDALFGRRTKWVQEGQARATTQPSSGWRDNQRISIVIRRNDDIFLANFDRFVRSTFTRRQSLGLLHGRPVALAALFGASNGSRLIIRWRLELFWNISWKRKYDRC